MLDPILSWEGEGELPTNKDAASILERYYFNEDRDEGVSTLEEMGYENDKGQIGDSEAMKNTEGPGGEEQAGTAASKTIQGAKKEKEKDIAKEDIELKEQDEEEKEEEKEDEKEDMEEGLELEDAIIEKLIAEMEGEEISEQDEEKDEEKEDKKEDEEKEVEEGEDFHGGDVKDAMVEEDIDQLNLEADILLAEEAEAKSSMQDAQGAGTQQAGTGDSEGEIPNRKDREDQMTKPADVPQDDKISDSVQLALDELEKGILEQDEEEPAPTGDEGEDEEEEKDLDVDKEMKKEQAPPPPPSAYVGGPSPKKGEDAEEDAYEESFRLFEEAIEEELEDVNTDDVKV
jgi:hypothetical protein